MKTFMTYGPANQLYEAAKQISGRIQGGKGSPEFQMLVTTLRDALSACDGAIKERKGYEAQIDQAREQTTDNLEIDDDPVLSPSDDGVWVSAWLWVPR